MPETSKKTSPMEQWLRSVSVSAPLPPTPPQTVPSPIHSEPISKPSLNFFHLAAEDFAATKPARKQDLFDQLLAGDVSPMFYDADENPTKYGDLELRLLEALRTGRKKLEELSITDRETLNRAVIDFAAARVPEVQKPVAKPRPAPREEDEEGMVAHASVDPPEGEPAPFWWR
jgi:hypothetical protein